MGKTDHKTLARKPHPEPHIRKTSSGMVGCWWFLMIVRVNSTLQNRLNSTLQNEQNSTLQNEQNSTLQNEQNSTLQNEQNSTLRSEQNSTLQNRRNCIQYSVHAPESGGECK